MHQLIFPLELQTWFAFFSVSIPTACQSALPIESLLLRERIPDILRNVLAFIIACTSTIFTVAYGFTTGQIVCLPPLNALRLLVSAHCNMLSRA